MGRGGAAASGGTGAFAASFAAGLALAGLTLECDEPSGCGGAWVGPVAEARGGGVPLTPPELP
jgi:hypothetical protein